tara:strand:+ start:656 stop:1540 length:885 start_codon:yes stop_codon:yes gene_type:complete
MDKKHIIHLFGTRTNCGMYFLQKASKFFKVQSYSRKKDTENIKFDFDKNYNKKIFVENSICVSFAPIWKFANFLNKKYKHSKDELKNIKAVIVCSSSSAETKKYTSNHFDKELNRLLLSSENTIRKICNELNIRFVIIRPTLIYGNFELFRDRNINTIIKILKILPLIFLPNKTGLRQPIHFSQLADCVLVFCLNPEIIDLQTTENLLSLGGDYEISYNELILSIRRELVISNKLNYFIIIKLPNRIFNFICAPLLLISPKLYDSLIRISIDLAGFTKSSNFLNRKNKYFKFHA